MSGTEPSGTIGWIELTVTSGGASDAQSVRDFYRAVAGWTAEAIEGGFEMIAPAEGQAVARIHTGDAGPAQWLAYVRVDDLATSVARARAKGGTVLREGDGIAVIRDPAGAVLALCEAAM